MSTIANPQEAVGLGTEEKRTIGHRNFDWIMTGLSLWIVGGVYLDGWAHLHGKVDESFFTPWHGVLYSGLLALLVFLGFHLYQDHRNDISWLKVLPAGYNLSLLGAGIFAFGGAADLVWHTLFGIEESVEATISPTHLILASGIMLIVTGPLRSIWLSRVEEKNTLISLLPMLLSLAFALSVITFLSLYAHPLVDAWPTTATARNHEINLSSELGMFLGQAAGVAGVLLQSGILMGVVLLGMRYRRLPFGSFTLVFTLNAALMSVLHDRYNMIPVVALAGLVADGLYVWLKAPGARSGRLFAFAFLMPAIYYSLYFLLLVFTEPIWWSVHMVVGTIVLAGAVGLLFSYTIHTVSTPLASSTA